ncbi:hypothetical protein QJQ45_027748, partial [Haematococcus lacustris]
VAVQGSPLRQMQQPNLPQLQAQLHLLLQARAQTQTSPMLARQGQPMQAFQPQAQQAVPTQLQPAQLFPMLQAPQMMTQASPTLALHWVLDPVNFRSMGGNAKPLPPVNQLDDEHSEHVVPEVARLAGAPYQTTLQELDSFLNSAWSSAMVRHANSILRTSRTVTVPGEPTVTYLADMDSRRAFWSVTAAEQFPILAKAAVRLLSVHVSTAAAERNWSVWTSIYRNALRNSLSVEQAEKLVYVKANAKYETDTLTVAC